MADAGDVRVTLKLMREQFDAGMKAVDAELKKFETQTNKTSRQVKSDFADVGREVAKLAAAYVGLSQAVTIFQNKIGKDQAANRFSTAMERLGTYTPAAAAAVEKLTFDLEYYGETQTRLFGQAQKLLNVTRDNATAFTLLEVSVKAASAIGTETADVVDVLSRAMQGLDVRRQIANWGLWSENIKTAGDVLGLVADQAGDVNAILGDQALAMLALKKSWNDFGESVVGFIGPAVAKSLQGWSMALATLKYLLDGTAAFFSANAQKVAEAENAWRDAIEAIQHPQGIGGGGGIGNLKAELEELRRLWGGIGLGRDGGRADGAASAQAGPDWREAREKLWGQELKDDLSDIDDWMEQIAHDGKQLAEWTDRQNELLKVQHDTYAEIERSAAALAGDIIGGLIDGTASWASILSRVGELIVRIIQDMATMRSLMSALGLSPGGATPGGGTEAPARPGGINAASVGGMSPLPVGGFGPAPIYVTVQGDVTRFAEFSEKVVTTGAGRMARLGR